MIFIPTFNAADFLERTLVSALNQTKQVDIVVVDNCSSDDTIKVAQKYDVEIVQNSLNLGRIGNWNRCIEIVQEREVPYFKLLFAGDILKSNAFEEYEKVFENNNIGLITSKYEIIEKDGTTITNQTIEKEKVFRSREALELNLQKRNWYASPSIQAFRTKAIKDVRFDEKLPWAADWKFCIDLSKQTDVYYVDKVLAEFHKDSRRYLDSQSNKLSSIAEEMYIMTNLMEELKLTQKYEKQIKESFTNKLVSRRDLPKFILKKVFG
ncbi:MAG: glycosyltransferase [Erysipelotrichia bacterium]|nr:glycosyltransferase [Erysipelotrichia bacterium]